MSLAPELAAFIGRPVKPSVTPIRVEGYAGHLRADRSEPAPPAPTIQEPTMPTGVYPRKKRAEKPAAAPKNKPAKTRKNRGEGKGTGKRKASATGPRFGVFEDGSVEIRLASCAGIIAPDDARELVAFMGRIGVKA